MRISIFGLGYVGAVTGACLARLGHQVIGVDPDARKRDAVEAGRSPIIEAGLDDLLAEVVAAGRLTVTDDCRRAVAQSDISLICVGTPSQPNGSLKTEYVERVCAQIGQAVRDKSAYHSIVVRSTVLPGTTRGLIVPALETACGGSAGNAFGISTNPEFLREGVSIRDFHQPPFTIIGTDSAAEFARVARMYEGLPGRVIHAKLDTAEAVKYGCNIFHALKITFANEMGMLCGRLGLDSGEVLDIITQDTKLNISDKYLKPGFAFGGSCLPKDLRASTCHGRRHDTPLPMFEAALASNRAQIDAAAQRIMSLGPKRIAMMGISFKEGTDDLRESPLVALAERLIGRGFDLRVYDPNVQYAALYGANKTFIDQELPHLKRILVDANAALDHAQVIVFGHRAKTYEQVLSKLRPRHHVFDLVRIAQRDTVPGAYTGLYWDALPGHLNVVVKPVDAGTRRPAA